MAGRPSREVNPNAGPLHWWDSRRIKIKSYYKVARKRFVDAVCLQAVNHFLVSGKTSPL